LVKVMEETKSKNKGLQVAGEHGASSTSERYGKEFLLAKIAEKGERRWDPELGPQTYDDLYPVEEHDLAAAGDYYEPPEDAAPPKPSMRDVLGPGGVIAQKLPAYEVREAQIQMAETVAEAIDAHQHCLVEAGTGCGKSFGYLIPVIYSGKKAIVSTAVKSLQDQLWRKDIPFLQSVLDRPFKAALLKGRGNYLCLARWSEEIGEQLMLGQSYEFADLKAWLETTEAGDLEELPFALSPDLRARVTVTADQCLGKHCPSFGDCFVERAKTKAEEADVVVVNHTLLTIDCALRQGSDDFARVLPDRDLVVLDEAHNLEAAATKAFETEISAFAIARMLRDKQVVAAGIDPQSLARVQDAADQLFDTLARLGPASSSYALGEPPRSLQLQAENLALRLLDVKRELERRNPFAMEGGPRLEMYSRFVGRIEEYAKVVSSILFPTEGHVCYVAKEQSKRGKQTIYLRKAPICVGPQLAEALWKRWPTIATSATLATAGGFDFFKGRIGCDEAREMVADSPFDYKANMLVYLPPLGAMLDPTKYYQEGSEEYLDRVAGQIEQLIMASGGRAFCLFTSSKALNAVYERIAHRLQGLVLKQGEAPNAELLKRFIADGRAVLFGLRSFFEGIDVKGDALSLVVIDKVPFGQPDDPIYQARCDEVTKRTHDKWAWFSQFALPSAILTLKQGVGRLIRTRTDRGVVALLDQRLATKGYGVTVLKSLPRGSQTRSMEGVKTFFATGAVVDPQQGTLL
jgi:Rad3-related DNA helicase